MPKAILHWESWIYGLISGFIGGGAGAIVSAFGAIVLKPEVFNLSSQLGETMKLMGITFFFHGALTAAAFLQKSPLPALVSEETTTVQVTKTVETTPLDKPAETNP